MLLVPASKINLSNKTSVENRTLAKPAAFIKDDIINQNYGYDFNKWFSDRFNQRAQLIYLDTVLRCFPNIKFCTRNNITYDKKNKIFYTPSIFGMGSIKDDKAEKLDIYVSNLQKFSDYCKKNKINLYLLIVPRRADFVKFNTPEKSKKEDFALELIDYLRKNTDVNIIFPYNEMQEANMTTPVYYKTDHHWTDAGAYVGYQALMKEIKKSYPDIKILSENDFNKYYDKRVKAIFKTEFNNGKLLRQFYVFSEYHTNLLDTDFLFYEHKDKNNLLIKNDSNLPNFNKETDNEIYYSKGYDKKILIIGDSFTGLLFKFVPYTFKHTVGYSDNFRYLIFDEYKELINTYKPDIIVLNMRSFYLYSLLNLYPNKFSREVDY